MTSWYINGENGVSTLLPDPGFFRDSSVGDQSEKTNYRAQETDFIKSIDDERFIFAESGRIRKYDYQASKILAEMSNVSMINLSPMNATTPAESFINSSLLIDSDVNATNVTNAITSGGSGGGRFIPWDNPENIMAKQTSDDITFCLQCIVFPILTIFGLLGSGLSLIILLQTKVRNSTTSIVLIGLSISDFCFLITNMARKSTCIIRQYDKLAADTFNAMSFGGLFYTKTAFSRVSTLLVVLISVERLIAVAFPLQVRSLITKPRMIAAVIVCYIIPFAFCAGLPPQYTYTFIRGRPYIAQTPFALDNVDSLKIYNEYFLVISLRYIPVILVIILNTLIIILFKRSRQFQNKQAGSSEAEISRQQQERKLTRMLLSVALIFLVCLLPGDAVLLISGINTKFSFFGTYHNFFLVISDLSLLFEIINSSINFIIYMVLNKLFYETYKSLFCRCFKGRNLRSKTSTYMEKTADTKSTTAGSADVIEDLKDFNIDYELKEEKDEATEEANENIKIDNEKHDSGANANNLDRKY